MQSLKSLNNVEKAKLLHNLMREQMPAFVDYLREQATIVVINSDELKANWQAQMFSADFWLELAESVIKRIDKYNKELKRSANVFSDQLFDGYYAVFTSHVLTYYIHNEVNIDSKFKEAVHLLFV